MLPPLIRVCTHGESTSNVGSAETSGCVGRAGDVGRASARTNLIDEISVLCLLAQLEVGGQEFAILVCEFVAKCLHSVGVDECAGCFGLIVDSSGDFASVLGTLITNCVDVAIGLAIVLSYGLFIPYIL